MARFGYEISRAVAFSNKIRPPEMPGIAHPFYFFVALLLMILLEYWFIWSIAQRLGATKQ